MRNIYLLFLAAVLSLTLFPSDASAWCNSSYSTRVPININTTTNLTNYQIPFNLTYGADMNASFSDLLFCDTSDVPRPFWIESSVNSTWAYGWINASVNNINGTQGYIYYGNPTATSQSNISATFIIGDEFNGASLDTLQWNAVTKGNGASVGVWGGVAHLNVSASNSGAAAINSTKTFTNNVSIVFNRRKVNSANNYYSYTLFGDGNITGYGGDISTWWNPQYRTGYGIGLDDVGGDNSIFKYAPSVSVIGALADNTYDTSFTTYRMDYWQNGTINFYRLNTTLYGTATDTTYASMVKSLAMVQGGYSGQANEKISEIDWVYVKNIMPVEPILSIGVKQSQGAIIASPTSSTYYTTNLTLNFTMTGANATYPCWKTLDGVITSLGNVANNTANASTITLNNSAHNVSVTCFIGSLSKNTTTTVLPTVTYSEIRAKNAVGGAAINTFTAVFGNGITNSTLFTTTGLIQTPLDALPQGAVNLTVTADGYGMNSTTNYTINSINFFNNTIYMQPASVTIYIYDEKTPTSVIFSNITFSNSTTSKTWNGVNNISQLYDNLTLGDTTITIASAGYKTRKYYMTITAQTLVNMSAYLLSTSLGSNTRFHTVTLSNAAIANVLVTTQSYINGAYVTSEQAYTDASGTGTVFLDPTANYQMVFTHPDYDSLITVVQTGGTTDYTIYMQGTQTLNISYLFGDLSFDLTPHDTAIFNTTNQQFNLTAISSQSLLTSWGLNLTLDNGTVLFSNTITTSPSGGTINAALDLTGMNSTLTAYIFFTKWGNYTVLATRYSIYTPVATNTNTTLVDIFGEMKSTGFGFHKESLGIIGLVITALVMGFISQYTLRGAGVVGVMCLAFLAYAGIFGWNIVIATGLLELAILIITGVM